jgi:23S rRNA pseudouridine2605 synthase
MRDAAAKRLAAGVRTGGETLVPQGVTLRKASARESHLVVTLTEGKNREVRRLCSAAGHEVTRLRRVQIGGISLGSLAPGQWRVLSEAELAGAFSEYGGR